MTEIALEARSVTKRFGDGTEALVSVDLSVLRGETVALVGESGSGKTTLLRTFNRMVEPTSGEVRVWGRPVAEQDPIALRRHTGYVQQEGGLLPHWTVERNVSLVPRLLGAQSGAQGGWPRERIRERVTEMLELVGLPRERFGGRFPSELSGGQRQRVAFARALAADPELVLMDEPFGALDALTRLELQGEFRGLQERLGKTMVLVTHDLGEAFRLADRVAVMREGRILRVGTPDELSEEPGDEYVKALLEVGGWG